MKKENKQFIQFIGIAFLIVFSIVAEKLINPSNVMQGCTVQVQWYHVAIPLICGLICFVTVHLIIKYWLDEDEKMSDV